MAAAASARFSSRPHTGSTAEANSSSSRSPKAIRPLSSESVTRVMAGKLITPPTMSTGGGRSPGYIPRMSQEGDHESGDLPPQATEGFHPAPETFIGGLEAVDW